MWPMTTMDVTVIVAFAVSAGVVRAWTDRQRRQRDVRVDRRLSCVIDVMLVWAQTWGQDPIAVRLELDRALDHHEMKHQIVVPLVEIHHT